MPWSPDKYNEFKKERYAPAFDLMLHIQHKPEMQVIDLGCGTGELTQVLAEKLNDATVLGIDNSAEMLENVPTYTNLSFEQRTINEQIAEEKNWDLIFTNAALQWVENHQNLFPSIISKIKLGGQLAVQMPYQPENLLNKILAELVQTEPYKTALNNFKRVSPVLSIDAYAQILFENKGKNITIYQKVYPIIAGTHQKLYDFISGSSLVPYMERLPEKLKPQFEEDYMNEIKKHFPKLPTLYAFKRVVIYATF